MASDRRMPGSFVGTEEEFAGRPRASLWGGPTSKTRRAAHATRCASRLASGPQRPDQLIAQALMIALASPPGPLTWLTTASLPSRRQDAAVRRRAARMAGRRWRARHRLPQ